ncbi:hypothetical protein APSETT444_008470 [Aspergillus pseudonomiae]
MASALAESYPSLLTLRLLDGMAASAPIAIVGGIYADIEADPTARGRLMAYYMTLQLTNLEMNADIYGMDPAKSGLCFLPIGVGAVVACVIFIWYDKFLSRAKARNVKWAHIEEYRRLPLACLGGPLYVVAIFFMGWTAFPSVHWSIPALSGIPFGAGYLLNFMAMANYMADAYETYSASAMSASACTRSILGAMLPLATKPMFDRLGVNWAYTLVGFLSLGVTVIPFVFIRYGARIRESSKFCQELKRLKETDAQGPPTDRSVGRSGEVSTIHVEPKDLENQSDRL